MQMVHQHAPKLLSRRRLMQPMHEPAPTAALWCHLMQRVHQTTEGAARMGTAAPGSHPKVVVSGGDFNVFPRPDDPFATGEPYGNGKVGPSDQLAALYGPALGLHNLFDTLLADVPASAYSYVFEGQAQTLDQQFATGALFDELVQIRAAHVNADFPADYSGDVARGASDHDPQVARWSDDVTLGRLHDLVNFFVATGQLDATKAGLLHDRLNRAAGFLTQGKTDAYRSQLTAFGDQAQDLVPAHLSQSAANALEREADRLAAR
jgi:hypothetical protein